MNEKNYATRSIIESAPMADWYDLLLRKELYSFYHTLPLSRLINDTKWELEELLQGVESWNLENIKEEIADVVFDTCQIIQALFIQDLINETDILWSAQRQKEKIYKRQPFLKDNSEKPNSWEEETALFKKLKNKNKQDPQLEILFNN